jgi:hypothetical protein
MQKYACESQIVLNALMVSSSSSIEADKSTRFRRSSSALNDPDEKVNLLDR